MLNTFKSVKTALIILLMSELSQSYIPSPRKEVESRYYQYLPKRVEWTYSLVHLKTLAIFEEEIYQLMKNCTMSIKGEHNLLDKMHSWIKNYEETTRRATGPILHSTSTEAKGDILASNVVSDPFLTFKMLNRFTKDLNGVIFPLPQSTEVICGSTRLLQRIASISKDFVIPIKSDVGKAVGNILRISSAYNLDVTSMIKGHLGKLRTQWLIPEHVHDIAEYAASVGLNMQALEWFYAGFQLSTDPNITEKFLFGLETIMAMRSDYSNKLIIRNLKMRNEQTTRYADIIFSQVMSRYQELLRKPPPVMETFERLCKGTYPEVHYQNPNLTCWYEKQIHPAWHLVPLKLELLNHEIGLTQVHDAFGQKFVNKIIKDASAALLAEPEHNAPLTQFDILVDERNKTESRVNSKVNWKRVTPELHIVKDWAVSETILKENPDIVELNKKIEQITGLLVDNTKVPKPYKASDDLHVNAYTFGGHTDIHFHETDDGQDLENGGFMTTFLIHLNDVDQGGDIVFPHIGIKVAPKMGSALFWNNLKNNVDLNPNTEHGVCPIISGTKWEATTWIHSNVNFLRRKCTLTMRREN